MNEVQYINLDFQNPFIPPADGKVKNKRTLSTHTKGAGCYLIKENDKIVYIGMSQSCVVAALYRHFYSWQDKRGDYRITYYDKLTKKKYSVVIIITTKEQAPLLEQSLIITLKPRDNKERYENIAVNTTGAPKKRVHDDLPF